MSRIGTQALEKSFGNIKGFMNQNYCSDQFINATLRFVESHQLSNVRGRNLDKHISHKGFDFNYVEIMSYYLPRAIVLLEYIGVPINMKMHRYYEAGDIPIRVP